jgi:iron complex outermembrane recepter protein
MFFSARRFAATASAIPFLCLALPAYAQNAKPAVAEEKEIIVTGSLIQRPNNTAVSPIVSISDAALKESGTSNLQDALNQLPGFTVGGNSGNGGQGTGGRATINLHGLGSNRNLVLLDGKRLPVSDIFGNVDVNILPEAIISGIDAITGGASAVYGSDAMSGVVNFKTLRKLHGIKADAMTSISERGDAFRFNGSLAAGTTFSEDRGHIIAAFSYSKQNGVDGSSRPFFFDKIPSSFIGTGTYVPSATNLPSAAVLQSVFSTYGITSTRTPTLNLGFNNDGTLFVQTGGVNYRGPNGTQGYAIVGGNVRMPVGQQIQISNALDRKTAFVKGDFDISTDLTTYGQFMYVDLTANTESGGSLTQFPALTTIPVTNPFIPTDLRTVLASRANPTAAFTWNGRYVGVPDKNWDENYKIQQYLVGLKGQIAEGWTFDLFGAYDQSVHMQTMHQAVLKSKVQQLLNAADGGRSLCAGGFNPFGDANARSLSAACLTFVTTDAVSTERLGQTQIQGQVNGKLFDLGAGPAQLAVVANWRRNSYSFAPDFNRTAASGFGPGANIESFVVTSPVSQKAITVKEIAGQIDIPLVADQAFFHELAIGGAARLSDYSTSGSVTSFEIDGRWRPVQPLLIRASFQRAVRAPNIGELFSPPQGQQLAIGTASASNVGDPCDIRSFVRTGANAAQVQALCIAQGVPAAGIGTYQFATTATGQTVVGNIGLSPEKASTFNIGFVFNAPRSSGIFGDVSLSADYYNIKIKDVISTLPGLNVLSSCFNLDGSNSGYSNTNGDCARISRDPATGQLLNVTTPFANFGLLQTDGIEMQLRWAVPAPFLSESAKLYVDTAVGWLNNYKVRLAPGAATLNYTNVSLGTANPGAVPPNVTPKWKALTSFGVRSDGFGFGLRWRHQGSLRDSSLVTNSASTAVGVPAYNLWDLFGSVKVNDKFEFRTGVNNLFDRALPFVNSSQNGTDLSVYDAIGRSFYMGVKFGF